VRRTQLRRGVPCEPGGGSPRSGSAAAGDVGSSHLSHLRLVTTALPSGGSLATPDVMAGWPGSTRGRRCTLALDLGLPFAVRGSSSVVVS